MVEKALSATEMPPQYDPADTEARWYERWVERGYFHANPASGREPYCIVIPPPNVTGALHVGHALGRTLEDMLIRRARMQGFETLWLPGTDHAGIATQVVVERELRKEGIDRRELGREKFVERVWAWKEKYGGRIIEQIKRLGSSCDWERLRFTMDEGLSRAVRVAFVTLYEDGLIYRGERIINWCPTDQTGLSDSELERKDVEGELVTFRYPLSDGTGHVDVATTRVETMLGDTAVAVHPDDPRYRDLAGMTVRHPFTGADLPIVADAAVDMEFGTGAVKVTPAHDPNDFEIAERAELPRINILNADASLSDAVPEEFRGLDRYEARSRVRERLRDLGLIVHEVRPYVHAVAHCYRCHSEIEPWISGGKQWFVAVDRLKEPAKQAALDGRVTFAPERWLRPYVDWLDKLRDWNISRQLWWGHRIPVWYCTGGHTFAAVEDPTGCARCGRTDIEQDPDVLDTWFSSQLWPFSTLGWPERTADLELFYPTSALVTGYEILYLWVARMIMSGLYFLGDVPFGHVVIHGLVRDARGRKMSKSLGNVIDPLDMIDRYGADALRFALARSATGGQQDIPLSEAAIEAGRHFANKIWNAARLVLRAFEGGPPELPPAERLSATEQWLLFRHQVCVREVDAALDEYRFADAAQALHRFTWSELCDWGLEMEKDRLYEDSPRERRDAAQVLAWVLERTLRLLHPVMPFVSEEIWQRLGVGESIVVAPWPEEHPEHVERFTPSQEELFGLVKGLITAVRRFSSDHRIPPRTGLDAHVIQAGSAQLPLEMFRTQIQRLAGISSLSFGDEPAGDTGFARLHVSTMQVLIPLAGLFDVGAEIDRLRKRLGAVEADAERSAKKLANESFRSNAPGDVVQAEEERLAIARREEASFREQIDQLEGGVR